MKAAQHSDWGVITTTIGGVKVTNGARVVVTWPDGLRSLHPVVFRKRRGVVYDMGHQYDVESDIAGIDVNVNGFTVWVELGRNGPEVEMAEQEGTC